MMNPKENQKEAATAEKNEVSASMLIPTSVLAIALFIIGFANAAIVGFLFNIFPV
jgi:hypothetical protein